MVIQIGDKLKEIREKYGDSLRSMANKLGISATYLSAIENGKRNVPQNFDELVMKYYNLSLDDQEELKNAIYQSVSTLKVDCKDVSNKGKEIIRLVAEKEIDEATIEKLYEIVNDKQTIRRL